MNQVSKCLPIAIFCVLFTACEAVSEPPSTPQTPVLPASAEETVALEESETEETEYGSFTEEQLYQAIISELGAQRGQIEIAGENYFDLAFSTRDLAIIERAVQFASVNDDTNALLQLGLLWADVADDSPQPHLMLAFQFLETGGFDQALSHMARVIDLGGEIDFSALSNRTGRLNPEARDGLIENLRQLGRQYPDNESISIALIQLLGQNRANVEALAELEKLKDRGELDPQLVLMEAQLIQNQDGTEEALKILRDGVRRFETDKNLRMSYARLLIQNEDISLARDQFQILIEQDPQDWETWYSIALLDMETENYDNAIVGLERLISFEQRVDESHYYLAVIYEGLNELEKSIDHYRQVRIGTNNYLAAQQQATRYAIQIGNLDDAHDSLSRQSRGQPRLEILFHTIESQALIQNGYADEAKSLLDTALNKFPNETDLLFARVLYYDSRSDRAGSETDLRQIIRMLPDDSRALNHLGYMLADQTTRYDEALELVERAIEISPDDPAIIDSLAWAQYKLGRYEEALQNLRRAFAAFPDAEVASHLGEVLWMMGREEEATRIWADALEEQPNSELLKEAMGRLQTSR